MSRECSVNQSFAIRQKEMTERVGTEPIVRQAEIPIYVTLCATSQVTTLSFSNSKVEK